VTELPHTSGAIEIDAERAFAFRAWAMHLDERIDSFRVAAFGGLQDTAPRAGLLGLHARATGVDPSSWEHPSLAQIWFRLGADYVVPRDDLAVFTMGAMPRDAQQAAALDELGEVVRRALDGEPMRTRDVVATLPELPHEMVIRAANVSGKTAIRWDARTTHVLPLDLPNVDIEAARLELARRFMHWFAPASRAQFGKWAAVSRPDVEVTWSALEAELVPVDVDGEPRWALAADEEALRTATRPASVRLLPGSGDPYLYLDQRPVPKVPVGVPPRVVNSLGGRIFVDGCIVGAWARAQNKVTLFAWDNLDRDRVEAEAMTLTGPLGKDVRLRWL
jgi:hypothetical protein